MFFKHWGPDDAEVGVVVVKAEFRRYPDGRLRAELAPEIAFEETFVGDPAWSPLLADQDIAPGKLATDLTIRATARAPDGGPATDWPVTVSIPDRLHYGFQVRGPSVWTHRRITGWRREAPELVSEVPITYALAFGGRAPGPEGQDAVHEFNPAGIGLVTRERLAARADISVPQIGALGEFMVDDPLAEMGVHGFGPIAKAWLPRRSDAGTFDEDWQRSRHPRMPRDYSLRFWNAAPGPLRIAPYLRGDEEISVTGIAHGPDPVRLRLPDVACALDLTGPETARVAMCLDTVALDLNDENPQAHTATLTWRATIAAPHRFTAAEVVPAAPQPET
ncbi:DUF2169 domain-containing protein [Loktanella sp. IMCC34160]|uniref:DUF2169 family type VI secretion system accessory protein n=1 Tax=Loktanella sp. IMCC34160 TaxID=2510646 RepID=UPI001A937EED|nr:DUF2169 domain-containing protein [Loktanella sp. IMCC34160]